MPDGAQSPCAHRSSGGDYLLSVEEPALEFIHTGREDVRKAGQFMKHQLLSSVVEMGSLPNPQESMEVAVFSYPRMTSGSYSTYKLNQMPKITQPEWNPG